MIDIEFIFQYLILMHANKYPELTGNLGNIALLKRCGQLGLIDEKLANETANTYRVLRKYQHNIRLQGEEKARVRKEKVSDICVASLELWNSLFSSGE